MLKVYGPLIKPALNSNDEIRTKLLFNGGLTPTEANSLISQGLIDAAVFGTLWIGNPDLQHRVEKGLEINESPDRKTFYAFPGSDPTVGYSDYPKAGEQDRKK